MDFSLSEEQEMLKRSARDFLQRECPRTLVRQMAEDEKGFSPQLWRNMANLGWQALAYPSEYGGAGGSFLDLVMLLEEMGSSLTPGPFLATVVWAGLYILEAGSKEQKKMFLPKIASGDTVLTLAVSEPGARYETDIIKTEATSHQDSFIINGTKLFVPYAHVADYLLCVTRTDDRLDNGVTTFIINANSPGISCTPLKTLGRDKQYEVLFENTTVSRHDILGKLNGAWADIRSVLQKATVALCAEMNGGTQQILDMTVNYAKERTQFGRPVGSFQVIQHRCADMLVALDTARLLTYDAAWKISQGLPCAMEVSMAKAQASESYRQATWTGMQIHGGVAYIEDHALPVHYRWAKAAEVTLGDADIHREIITRKLLDSS